MTRPDLRLLLPIGALIVPACAGSGPPVRFAADPVGVVRPVEPLEFQRRRTISVDRPLLALDLREDLLALLQRQDGSVPGGIFLLDPATMTALGRLAVERPAGLGVAGGRAVVLREDGSLVPVDLSDPTAPSPGETLEAGPASCLALRSDLLALGRPDGVVSFHRLDSGGRPELEAAALCALAGDARSAVSALAYGQGEAGRYLYATLRDRPELIIVDLENPSGPAVCGRLEVPAARALSTGEDHLLLLPAGNQAELLVLDLFDPAAPRADYRLPAIDLTGAALHHGLLLLAGAEDDLGRVWVYRRRHRTDQPIEPAMERSG